MLVLTNTAAENAYAPSLYPSATTPVELEEKDAVTPRFTEHDSISLSPESLSKVADGEESSKAKNESEHTNSEGEKSPTGEELTDEDKDVIEELKERDQEVRVHEQAHVAAGGAHVQGGPSYTYQNGPDGKKYAIGGEVNIDTSPVSGDPDATITKMQTVRAAALAPAEPSSKDRSVAAQSSQAITQAHADKQKMTDDEKAKEDEEKHEETPMSSPVANNALSAYTQNFAQSGNMSLIG